MSSESQLLKLIFKKHETPLQVKRKMAISEDREFETNDDHSWEKTTFQTENPFRPPLTRLLTQKALLSNQVVVFRNAQNHLRYYSPRIYWTRWHEENFHFEWGRHHYNRGNELLKKVMSKKKMMPLGTVLTRNLVVQAMLDEVIECYTKAHLHQPSKQEVLVNRCLVYKLAGKLEEAAQDAELAFNMKPFDIKAMYRLPMQEPRGYLDRLITRKEII